MRQPGWYVVQVQTGKEQAMCTLIERVCRQADVESDIDSYQLLQECFSPRWRTRHKFHGEWLDVEKPLLPGYVVAVTADPGALAQRLRGVREFSRLLSMGEAFVPLRDDERAWMEEWTSKGERVIPISIAHRKGERLVVTEGPLKGREGMITRINRGKCLAFVELHVDGKRVTTTVGLAIVPETDADGATE